jgi:hypothetical protein
MPRASGEKDIEIIALYSENHGTSIALRTFYSIETNCVDNRLIIGEDSRLKIVNAPMGRMGGEKAKGSEMSSCPVFARNQITTESLVASSRHAAAQTIA